jgi:hypothetical protein
VLNHLFYRHYQKVEIQKKEQLVFAHRPTFPHDSQKPTQGENITTFSLDSSTKKNGDKKDQGQI